MEISQVKQTIVPYFMVLSAPQFIEFIEKVFNGEVTAAEKLEGTDGIIHGEMKIGESIIYFADTSADGSCGPSVCGDLNNEGLVPIQMFIFVENLSETYNTAIAAGAVSIMEPGEETTGQMAGFADPFGNLWRVKSAN